MTKFIFGVVAAIAFQSGTPALAETQTEVVHYADLNLATSAGQAALMRRIRIAVDHVCGQTGAREVYLDQEIGKCRREAFRHANPQATAAISRFGGPTQVAQAGPQDGNSR